MTNKSSKPQSGTAESFSAGLGRLRTRLLSHAERLDSHLEALIEEVEVVNNPDKGTHFGMMLFKHAQIYGELRKAEAAERKRSADLTPAAVMTWFRELGPAERGRLVREIQQLDSKRSGLA